jgi:hypothetical protein
MQHVWGRAEGIQGFGGKPDGKESTGVNGWIILRWMFRKLNGGMTWIGVAQDRDR